VVNASGRPAGADWALNATRTHVAAYSYRDLDNRQSVETETVWRLHSMAKYSRTKVRSRIARGAASLGLVVLPWSC
jgi:hypothetical protein